MTMIKRAPVESFQSVEGVVKEDKDESSKKKRLEIVKGDITKQEVDAIVNAAHEGLTGGGGVDGAIHKAAGAQLAGECINQLYGCPVSKARITCGYDLPASYVIHTVGPVWRGGAFTEKLNLSDAYTNCLKMASMQGLKSIAFPCISTGAYMFPQGLAATVAFNAIDMWLEVSDIKDEWGDSLELVRLVCFDESNYKEYLKILPEGFKDYK